MSMLDETINYKGLRIEKTATSSGYLYRIKHFRAPKSAMTSLKEAKAEVNKLLKAWEAEGSAN